MRNQSNIINLFSEHLFWDVDKGQIDIEKHAIYIINNVLQYGFYNDFKVLCKHYGLKNIVKTALVSKSLDQKTISLLALISNKPISKFACFTTKQSIPKHWNF